MTEYSSIYYKNNKKHIQYMHAKLYKKKREEKLEYQSKYRKEHKEEVRSYYRKWYKNNRNYFTKKYKPILYMYDITISQFRIILHKISLRIKERDGYKCTECGETSNLEMHHIKPSDIFPQYVFDDWNLITLCKKHHAQKEIIIRNRKV